MFKIQVYLDDGRIFEYEVKNAEKAREHTDAISKNGYRHNDGNIFEVYPVHRILKVKAVGDKGVPTNYKDKTLGT